MAPSKKIFFFILVSMFLAGAISSTTVASQSDDDKAALGGVSKTEGDPLIGMNLYTGEIPFAKQGLACMACHNISGIGILGGGTLGPDLTQSYKEFGDEGIISVLDAPSIFPTMKPVYENRPFTSKEKAHLKAFFQTTAAQKAKPATLQFGIFASIGFLFLILAAQILWRRRLRSVRRSMVEETLRKEAL